MHYDSPIRNHRKNEISSKQEEAISEVELVAECLLVQYDLKQNSQPTGLRTILGGAIRIARNSCKLTGNPSLSAYHLHGCQSIQIKFGGK
jgi:hypothetical protein